MGRINTGGAKKRTGDNIALTSSVSGTTLKLSPPKGYYDGTTGTVNIIDADFIAGNIKTGVNLFGKVGTLPDGTGKRSFASGTFSHTGSPATQNIATGLSTIDWAGVYVASTTSIGIIDTGVSNAVSGGVSGISVSGGTIVVTSGNAATFKWFAVATD